MVVQSELSMIPTSQKEVIFAVLQKGGKMISDGMVRELKDFYKDYKGCRNCKHQPEPMQMCEWGKHRERVEPICSGWERRKDG